MLRLRVAAFIVRDGRILLARHYKAKRSTYLLPGGGTEQGEFARDALARELREEAGVECAVGDLRYVVEVRAPDGRRHIIQLVFAARTLGEPGRSTDPRVAECAWHPIADLRRLPIRPSVGTAIADDLERSGRSLDRPSARLRYLLAAWRP